MRDGQIVAMHEATATREMLILRQLEFVQTKQQAYEELLASGFGARIQALFNWPLFRHRVDNRQRELLAERDRQMKEAMNKPKLTKVHS